MTVFMLKLIAMATMLVDHTAYWFVDNNNVMRNIGRPAFIIYAFLIAESYYHLREKPERLRSHALKLLILCLVSEIPYDQFTRCKWIFWDLQSVMPTLLFGFLALIASERWEKKCSGGKRIAGGVVICIAAALITYLIRSSYKVGGVFLIVLFYQYLKRADDLSLWQKILALLLIDLFYICTYIWASAGFGGWAAISESATSFNRRLIGSLAAVVPLVFYNRKLGYQSRWFGWLYSSFYPLQFVVLVIVRTFTRLLSLCN